MILKNNAILPEEEDVNFQDFIYDSEYFIRELNRAINAMGPVYAVNPELTDLSSGFYETKVGQIIAVVIGVIVIALFVSLMELLFT